MQALVLIRLSAVHDGRKRDATPCVSKLSPVAGRQMRHYGERATPLSRCRLSAWKNGQATICPRQKGEVIIVRDRSTGGVDSGGGRGGGNVL